MKTNIEKLNKLSKEVFNENLTFSSLTEELKDNNSTLKDLSLKDGVSLSSFQEELKKSTIDESHYLSALVIRLIKLKVKHLASNTSKDAEKGTFTEESQYLKEFRSISKDYDIYISKIAKKESAGISSNYRNASSGNSENISGILDKLGSAAKGATNLVYNYSKTFSGLVIAGGVSMILADAATDGLEVDATTGGGGKIEE